MKAIFLLATLALAPWSALADCSAARTFRNQLDTKVASEIPLTMNALVVRELTRFVCDPSGQRLYREGVKRLPIYRTLIQGALQTAKLPAELIAVPLIESGFKNEKVDGHASAGLWQIMPQTGRNLGLVVTEDIDERLDETRATQAALKYLRDLNQRYADWRLALKGYNEGEHRVDELINDLGTRDPWEIETQAEGPEHYLSKFTAAVYLLKSDGIL
jgi:membrane-bound lytic murein transglycosylase D